MVVNLDDGVAVTQNFVSRTNLPHVMRFLRTGRADTISGLDKSERHELHDRFLGALKRQLPAVAAQYESERDAKRRRIEADNRLAAMFKSEAAAAGTPGTSPLGGEGTQSADVEGSGDSGGKARAVHGGAHGNFRMGGAAASAGSVAADLPAASNGELHGGGFSFGFKL
mmetsp:Transcript_5655/g.17251  ORF Transcript_5655/g.17251 Transcript_5655/m.17251 type:complete len:169 (-) Transcript_5655:341-847(-)